MIHTVHNLKSNHKANYVFMCSCILFDACKDCFIDIFLQSNLSTVNHLCFFTKEISCYYVDYFQASLRLSVQCFFLIIYSACEIQQLFNNKR